VLIVIYSTYVACVASTAAPAADKQGSCAYPAQQTCICSPDPCLLQIGQDVLLVNNLQYICSMHCIHCSVHHCCIFSSTAHNVNFALAPQAQLIALSAKLFSANTNCKCWCDSCRLRRQRPRSANGPKPLWGWASWQPRRRRAPRVSVASLTSGKLSGRTWYVLCSSAAALISPVGNTLLHLVTCDSPNLNTL